MAQITPTTIKQRLVGLGPWLDAAKNLEAPYTYDDTAITANIAANTRNFERDAQFNINPVQIWTTIDGNNPTAQDGAGNPYPVQMEDPYDYQQVDSIEYFRLQLKHRPVQQVQRVRLMYGSMQVWSIPPAWFQVKNRAGLFHVVPVFGSLEVAAAATGYALMGMGFGSRQYLPNAVAVDYTVGLPVGTGPTDPANWQNLIEWQDLVYALNEYCAFSVLKDIAYLADAGVLSVSTSGGGSSESHTYDRFEKRKEELFNSAMAFKATIKEQETLMQFSFI